MLNKHFSTAVSGMLYYYGVMSIPDILLLGNRNGLCCLNDYQSGLQLIRTDLVQRKKAYFYKKRLCHIWMKEPAVMINLQNETVAADFKTFPIESYLKAGRARFLWPQEGSALKHFLAAECHKSEQAVDQAIMRLWVGINNMEDFVALTTDCIVDLQLPWRLEDASFWKILGEIRNMAIQMPRWYCKGYSCKEIASYEDEQRG